MSENRNCLHLPGRLRRQLCLIFLAVFLLQQLLVPAVANSRQKAGCHSLPAAQGLPSPPLPVDSGDTEPQRPSLFSNPPDTAFPGQDNKKWISLKLESENSLAASAPSRQAEITTLAAPDLEKLLARLSPLKSQAAAGFVVRPAPGPPPPAQTEIKDTFPPPPDAPSKPACRPAGPLVLLTRKPEGPIGPETNQLAVSFSQPMVPLAAVRENAARQNVVSLKPCPKGNWRWLDTHTLVFEPEGKRFPFATRYEAAVQAGTVSAAGGKLEKPESWTFTTALPAVQFVFPGRKTRSLSPHILIGFNQNVDCRDALKKISVHLLPGKTTGPKPVRLPFRELSEEELSADRNLRRTLAALSQERRVGIRCLQELPPDACVEVTVDKDIRAREGPLSNAACRSFRFSTYGPLRLLRLPGRWGANPNDELVLNFNNKLNDESFSRSMVKVRPEIANASIGVFGDTIRISGKKKSGLKYTITVAASLADEFGQSLGRDSSESCWIQRFEPALYSADHNELITLSPGKAKTYSLFTINCPTVKVSAYKVNLRDRDNSPLSALLAGRKPDWTSVLQIKPCTDQMVETRINLERLFGSQGCGNILLNAEMLPKPKHHSEGGTQFTTWIQSTNLRLETIADAGKLKLYATALDTGLPLAGVQVFFSDAQIASTDGNGLATLPLPDTQTKPVFARRQDDGCFLPGKLRNYRSNWGYSEPQDKEGCRWQKDKDRLADCLRWYVFTDRGVYRPGERVYVKGCLRRLGSGPTGDIGKLAGEQKVELSASSWKGKELNRVVVRVDAYGAFWHVFDLPAQAETGSVEIKAALANAGASIASGSRQPVFVQSFMIEEFRRPEFTVSLAAQSQNSAELIGRPVHMTLAAKQYSGGALSGADVRWDVTAEPADFVPCGWSGYFFGPWDRSQDTQTVMSPESPSGRTDSTGTSAVRIDLSDEQKAQPVGLSIQGTVTDINRQAISASHSLIVHPSLKYVGLKRPCSFVHAGEPISLAAIVTDIDGNVQKARIKFRVLRREWNAREKKLLESEAQEREIESEDKPITVQFPSGKCGSYFVQATVADEDGRRNISETVVDVYDTGERAFDLTEPSDDVVLIADKKEYADGDIAEVLIRAPFNEAHGTAAIGRDGIVAVEPVKLKNGMGVVKIPIKDVYAPALHVDVELLASERRQGSEPGQWWASRLGATLELPVPPRRRALAVRVAPLKSVIEPGGTTSVSVAVADAEGKSVAGSQVTIAVVDESVLALSDYKLADPLAAFYEDRGIGISCLDSADTNGPYDLETARKNAEESLTAGLHGGSGAGNCGGGGGGGGAGGLSVRSDFNPLALFETSAITGTDGQVRVALRVPDNLTRYRIMAFALSGEKQFGTGESNITARLPLALRPSPPRFLNLDDQCRLSLVLQNESDVEQDVAVALRGSNADLLNGVGKRVRLAAGQRRELIFPTKADRTGQAVFQAAASAGKYGDAAEFSLPVYTPTSTETFATYGSTEKDEVICQPVSTPANAFSEFGGMEVSLSSTALAELTDAVLYLKNYDFECSEQLSSRLIVLSGLKDILLSFKLQALDLPALDAAVARDIKLLSSRQNQDGSFGLWKKGDHAWPFVSIYAARALHLARERGFQVDAGVLNKSTDFLKKASSKVPAEYPEQTKTSLEAFALYVRALHGDRDAGRAAKILQSCGTNELSPETLSWLLSVLSGDRNSSAPCAEILKTLRNRVSQTASTAELKWTYNQSSYLTYGSLTRGQAVFLEALLAAAPTDELIPKLVKGLLKARRHGCWSNTQQNAFACLALDKYFRTYEKVTPDFRARLWLGDIFLSEEKFAGRSTDSRALSLPMSFLSARKAGSEALLIAKQGPGRLYYRLALNYAPEDARLPALDCGFKVERTYEGVDHAGDARRDADGVWHVKSGALLRVRLAVSANASRYHVALVDPLPAAFEPLNPELSGTTRVLTPFEPDDDTKTFRASANCCRWANPIWYDYENLRDNRAEVFTPLLWEGDHKYSYLVRATTSGRFTAPPAKAEEMYEPETFGRTASETVLVE
jgi:alpha-2-macroglobulin